MLLPRETSRTLSEATARSSYRLFKGVSVKEEEKNKTNKNKNKNKLTLSKLTCIESFLTNKRIESRVSKENVVLLGINWHDRAVFNWQSQVISRLLRFCITRLGDWLKNVAPAQFSASHMQKQKNLWQLWRAFRRFPALSAGCILCYVSWLANLIVCVCPYWSTHIWNVIHKEVKNFGCSFRQKPLKTIARRSHSKKSTPCLFFLSFFCLFVLSPVVIIN